jgi:protein-arginine kinase activator protein McsA
MLDFETAALLRDEIKFLQEKVDKKEKESKKVISKKGKKK